MDDKDFDNILRHKMGQAAGLPATENGWNALSQRLSEQDIKRWRWLLPFLLVLLLLLGAGNVFWWFQWAATTRYSHATTAAIVLRHDTIVHTTIVYQYDTVYRYTKIQATESIKIFDKHTAAATKAPEFGLTSTAPTAATLLPAIAPVNAPNLPGAATSATAQVEFNDKTKTIPPADDGAAVSQTLAALDTLLDAPAYPKKYAVPDTLARQPATPIVKKSRAPVLYFTRTHIGLAGGWAVPSLSERHGLWRIGALVNAEIARNFRLEGGVQYLSGEQGGDESGRLGAKIPIPQPGGTFRLHKWEIERYRAIIYSVQLHYQLPLWQKIRPYIGIGMQAATVLPSTIEYEFRQQNNDPELALREAVPASMARAGTTLNLGVERQLTDRWIAGIEGYWLHDWNRSTYLPWRHIGLNVKIKHIFIH